MRLTLVRMVVLSFTFGCVRLGYDARRVPTEKPPDAAPDDGGTDVTVADAGSRPDASVPDASEPDAAVGTADAGALDASAPDAAHIPDDGAMQAATDGGVIDGAAHDGAVDSGPPDLCPERSDAIFCDGFEDPTFSRWSYTVIRNGALERTTARARSGEGSLHATTGAAGAINYARYGARVFANQKSGDIWLRSYYYIPGSVVANPFFSTSLVTEVEPPYSGFSLLVRPDQAQIGGFGEHYDGTMLFPRDRWTCVELHVQIDASAGIFEAFLDGALVARSSATNTLPAKGYTSVDLGIHYTAATQGPVEVYVDDVVAGNTRLGCD